MSHLYNGSLLWSPCSCSLLKFSLGCLSSSHWCMDYRSFSDYIHCKYFLLFRGLHSQSFIYVFCWTEYFILMQLYFVRLSFHYCTYGVLFKEYFLPQIHNDIILSLNTDPYLLDKYLIMDNFLVPFIQQPIFLPLVCNNTSVKYQVFVYMWVCFGALFSIAVESLRSFKISCGQELHFPFIFYFLFLFFIFLFIFFYLW